MSTCHICGNSTDNKSYVAREMMFGFRDEFDYFECARCGCVQIIEFPTEIAKYYPENYYSFQATSVLPDKRNFTTIFADRQRAKHNLGYGGWLGEFLSKRRPKPLACEGSSLSLFDWLREAKVRLDYKILDIGCGAGYHLLDLQKNGFSNLTGIDPFIADDIVYENGVEIFKREVHEVQEQFDFIMLNHSFEHMQNQLLVIKELYRILKPNRYALIRIPVASSFAWKTYQTNWVQLDAPRHFFLHTVDSLKLLAEQAGFTLDKFVYDSIEFQFLASERYIKDIPLIDSEKPYAPTSQESRMFREKADDLNSSDDGDQACFYLYKSK
jgi:SAM-dependent methyltransferase